MRAGWLRGDLASAIAVLEPLLAEEPDDPRIVATAAMAFARSGFYGNAQHLERARVLADNALALTPDLGEAQLARAQIHLYAGELPAAAAMLARTVRRAPGFALAQGSLGALLLEAGHLEDALIHLEAAYAIDPSPSHISDLSRAYVYAGRFDDGLRLVSNTGDPLAEISVARFHMWRGERYQVPAGLPPLGGDVGSYFDAVVALHATGRIPDELLGRLVAAARSNNLRLRAARAPFMAEFGLFGGDRELAMQAVELSVEAGLHDALWMQRCPLLESLRALPKFQQLAATVEQRANALISAAFAA